MSELVTYYAVFLRRADEPDGLARRRRMNDGGVLDEMLRHDLMWSPDSLITEWMRGDSTEDLVEISEEEARELIERFRERWGREA